MTISELKAFNICEEKIEKERIFRAYISEINQRYNKIIKRKAILKVKDLNFSPFLIFTEMKESLFMLNS